MSCHRHARPKNQGPRSFPNRGRSNVSPSIDNAIRHASCRNGIGDVGDAVHAGVSEMVPKFLAKGDEIGITRKLGLETGAAVDVAFLRGRGRHRSKLVGSAWVKQGFGGKATPISLGRATSPGRVRIGVHLDDATHPGSGGSQNSRRRRRWRRRRCRRRSCATRSHGGRAWGSWNWWNCRICKNWGWIFGFAEQVEGSGRGRRRFVFLTHCGTEVGAERSVERGRYLSSKRRATWDVERRSHLVS